VAIRSPSELIDVIMAEGEKGLALQRYKGLGEKQRGDGTAEA